MTDPFTPRVEGDRLYGRGAADIKGGLAAVVAAAEHLVATGARSLRVFAVVRLRFAGRAAHSSRAELGVNAVTHLGRLMHAVDQRAPAVRADGGDLMVTVVSGGQSAFVVPDRAECLVELRTTPDQPSREALAGVLALLDPQGQTEAGLVAHRDGWRLDGAGPAATLSAELGDALGTGPTFDAPCWMEAPPWAQPCPRLICVPSGGGLHAVEEWVDLGHVRTFATTLVQVLRGWTPRGH